jgi:hypothetical protein
MNENNYLKFLQPIFNRNETLSNETEEEKIKRLKKELGLFHGRGKNKKQRNKSKKGR